MTLKIIFYIGIVTLSILSIGGTIYTTKLVFANENENKSVLTPTQKNISKSSVILIWMLIIWSIIGSILINCFLQI